MGRARRGPCPCHEQERRKMRYVITRTAAPRISGFDTFFSDFFGDTATRKIPPVDIYETDTAYVIEAEIAGYSEKDIEVVLKDGVITISSEETWKERRAREREERNMIASEIVLPEFSRSFKLPEDADTERVGAESHDGILSITIPRLRKAEPGRIEIKINK